MSVVTEPTLVQCEIDDLFIDNDIYVRSKPARVISFEYPLVFFQFKDDVRVLHRSYISSKEQFQIQHDENRKRREVVHSDDELESESEGDGFEFAFPPVQGDFGVNVNGGNAGNNNNTQVTGTQENWDEFGSDFEFASSSGTSVQAMPVLNSTVAPTPSVPVFSRAPKIFCMDKHNESITYDSLSLSQALFVENCSNCNIVITSKINNVQVINCSNMRIQFGSLIASFELVRCDNVEVVCDKCSTICLEQVSSCSISFNANQIVLLSLTSVQNCSAIAYEDSSRKFQKNLVTLGEGQYFTRWQNNAFQE